MFKIIKASVIYDYINVPYLLTFRTSYFLWLIFTACKHTEFPIQAENVSFVVLTAKKWWWLIVSLAENYAKLNAMKLERNFLLYASIVLLLLFSVCSFLWTPQMYTTIEALSVWVRNVFGRYYLYIGLFCVVFILIIALSPLGKLRLGNKDEKPEYSRWAWIAMLYSSGMGAGIILRAVQEPVFMQQSPPIITSTPRDIFALEFTFYQWGFTAWAFYGLFALVIGYYLYTKKRSSLVSSVLQSECRNKKILTAVDLVVVISTVFGLVGAVVLGATQMIEGIAFLGKWQSSILSVIIVTLLLCTLSFISAWKGINAGIKNISKINIYASFLLLGFVLFIGDTGQILSTFAQACYHYIIDFPQLSLAIGRFNIDEQFLSDWTYYYWAFWLAWAPFTGVFIARISRGRTFREMLLGVMIIPSMATFLWFSAFGQTAFSLIEQWGTYSHEFDNVFSSIFVFFSNFPMSSVVNTMIIILLGGFLLTSIDSALYVLSMFTDKGRAHPQKLHRCFWFVIITIFSVAMILLGNSRHDVDMLIALQKILIITSLPFALFIPLMCYFFLRDVFRTRKKHRKE